MAFAKTLLGSSIASSLRSARSQSFTYRSLSSSKRTLRNSEASTSDINDEMNENFDVDDLFDTSGLPSSTSSSSSSDRSAKRSSLVQSIFFVASLPTAERKSVASQSRIGQLRKVVSLSDAEDLDELKEIIKAWRLSGRRITKKTAEVIVGRCVNLGRADLAREIVGDQLQYGLPPLPEAVQKKIA